MKLTAIARIRRRPARTLAAFAAGLLVLLVALEVGSGGRSAAAKHRSKQLSPAPHLFRRRVPPGPPLPRAELTVSASAPLTSIPRSFLGVSTEYWTLPIWERHLSLLARVLELLRVRGEDPLVLRVGGDSSDRSLWEPSGREVPEWAFELTPSWLSQTRALVRLTGVRLILDLNLVSATPAIAAQWARAASLALPRRSIIGFEIGNEPDIYSRADWLAALTRVARGILPSDISATGYDRDFRSYARVLSQVAPGVPLLAPALANPLLSVDWIATLLDGPHPGLGAITVHRYPYSACSDLASPSYPTLARILSQSATAGMAATIRPAMALARGARLPLELSELNSVTCGGRPGVSDTFATALWAPDALFELLRAGVASVKVHVREYAVNAAFVFVRHNLVARPLLYGLITFARMLGPNAKLVQMRLHAKSSLALKAWAVRIRGGILHVLVIDKGRRGVRVLLRVPAQGPATVERLLAPSASARSGVTLAGQRLDGTVHWRGAATIETLLRGAHGYELTVPRRSAALVSLHLSAGALSPR